ncbi:hypothetical protein [Thiobacter aerophilum]|uniref:YggT family protein n=1 Tax=Thiobacter aerophilum TaxID=3121275 RepID=A0ABV0EH17_9BURK
MNAAQQIFLISVVRTLVEVAGWALLGQGLLALLVGSRRHENLFYQIFEIITRPVLRLTRLITPRVILDAHIPFVAFFLLFWLWLGLAWLRHQICLSHQLAC